MTNILGDFHQKMAFFYKKKQRYDPFLAISKFSSVLKLPPYTLTGFYKQNVTFITKQKNTYTGNAVIYVGSRVAGLFHGTTYHNGKKYTK
jgi:hypothetical protein